MNHRSLLLMTIACLIGCAATSAHDEPPMPGQQPMPRVAMSAGGPAANWREAEAAIFADWVQLTFSDRFVRAGESYFSPDDSKIIFQAVEQPANGEAADPFYAMFVADVVRNQSGAISGINHIRRLSPKGSANTCGWFHPTHRNLVLFASTVGPPSQSKPPGFDAASTNYTWMFPPEMRIVQCDLETADGSPASLKTLVGDGKAYCAEGSLSSSGRHLLYCSLESGDGDLYVFDLTTRRKTRIVQARGYDGGPFFSPDGRRVCYRSDRLGDQMLQLFVADLAFNDAGEIVGIEREYQLTDQACVNWCPFWTPDGRRLVYASSELGESNFEVYMCDADPGNLPGSTGTIRYGTAARRLTHFEPSGSTLGSDVLPAFSSDGTWMMWTSRRSVDGEVHLVAARFVLDPDAPWKPSPVSKPDQATRHVAEHQVTIEDPVTHQIFVYDLNTHSLSEYDMTTHTLKPVTDERDIKRFMELHKRQGQRR